ncbi:YrrS family protein [Lentibacillus halophilus]|uniref:YrrS family protein n=1 Tax=Lentibacillus halophilus TaxID=295065 RepID=A0ABP3J5S2_9BACI
MSDDDHLSRINKYEKRRKNTRSLSVFIVLGSILLIALVLVLIFSGGDESNTGTDESSTSSNNDTEQKEAEQHDETGQSQSSNDRVDSENSMDKPANNNSTNDQTDGDDSGDNNDNNDSMDSVDTEQVSPSDDNVIKAYTGDWKPVGTDQSGPHTTDYNEGSQDREEMREAVAAATGLNVDTFTMWYVSRNGDQQVLTTVSSNDESTVYRVYLSWIKHKGWKPTKVERLKENDQKWRYE